MALGGEPREPVREQREDVDVHQLSSPPPRSSGSPMKSPATSMRPRATSTARTASLTIGTSSGSPPAWGRTSSASQEGSSISRATVPSCALAVEHLAALEFVRPPLALLERGRRLGGHRQLHPTQRLGRLASIDSLEAHDRARVGARPARDRGGAPADRDGAPEREQPCARAGHVEAAVEAVGTPHPPRRDRRGSARLRQSTMSRSTWHPSPAAAALTTVRSACAVRPLRPITRP